MSPGTWCVEVIKGGLLQSAVPAFARGRESRRRMQHDGTDDAAPRPGGSVGLARREFPSSTTAMW